MVDALRFAVCVLGLVLGTSAPAAGSEALSAATSSLQMRRVGHHALSGRPAYMPHVQQQGQRWILYVAHHRGSAREGADVVPNGTSILDVTDPARPTLLAHVPGAAAPNDEARSVRACTFANGKTYLLRSVGQTHFDVHETTDPSRPVFRARIGGDDTYTHKVNWECETGIAYLPMGNATGLDPGGKAPRWKRGAERLEIWRIQDPGAGLQVEFVRSFGLPGMLAGSTLPSPTNIHHAIVDRERRRVHIGYGCCGGGIYQIVDREKLLDPARRDSVEYPSLGVFPQAPGIGIHTAYPLNAFAVPGAPGARDLAIVVGEAIGNECATPRQSLRIVDVTPVTAGVTTTRAAQPAELSRWSLPASSGPLCEGSGWFGPHSTNESYTEPFYGKLLAVAYFGGGVRMVDVRDPLHPREVAHYVPAPARGLDAIQTNNAEVDARGYVYVVDRWGSGLDVLELTGSARAILFPADRPPR